MKWHETERYKLTGLISNESNFIAGLNKQVKYLTDTITGQGASKMNYGEVRRVMGEVSKLNLELFRANSREKKLKFRLQELEKIVHSITEREGQAERGNRDNR